MDVAKGIRAFEIDVRTPNRVQRVALRVTWNGGSPQSGEHSWGLMLEGPESRIPDGGWTRADTNVDDLKPSSIFVLVGEILWTKSLPPAAKGSTKFKKMDPTPPTSFVGVRMQGGDRLNWHILRAVRDQSTGLFGVMHMPKKLEKYVAWYSEWVEEESLTTTQDRQLRRRQKLREFIESFGSKRANDQSSDVVAESPAMASDAVASLSIREGEKMLAHMMRSVHLVMETGNLDYAGELLRRADRVEGSKKLRDTDPLLSASRHVLNGPGLIGVTDAEEYAKIFTSHWPSLKADPNHPIVVRADYLRHLSKCLHDGALNHMHIGGAYHRAIIIEFCAQANKGGNDWAAYAQEAHRIAVRHVQPIDICGPTVSYSTGEGEGDEWRKMFLAHLKSSREDANEHVELIDTLIRMNQEEVDSTLYKGSLSMEEAIQRASTAKDKNELDAAVREMAAYSIKLSCNKLEFLLRKSQDKFGELSEDIKSFS